jgi:hypothetical protein
LSQSLQKRRRRILTATLTFSSLTTSAALASFATPAFAALATSTRSPPLHLTLPPILTLHLKRFQYINWMPLPTQPWASSSSSSAACFPF